MCRYTISRRVNRALAVPIILLAPLCTQPALAQDVPVVHQFIGAWEGHGKLFGVNAKFSMKWEWVLEKQFVRLTFQNRMQSPEGVERMLKAQAFYKSMGAGGFEGTWFDSRGMILPLKGSVEQNTLTTHWGSPETEQGRTVYRLLDEKRFEVEDFVLRDDQWHRFGHATLRRLAENP